MEIIVFSNRNFFSISCFLAVVVDGRLGIGLRYRIKSQTPIYNISIEKMKRFC